MEKIKFLGFEMGNYFYLAKGEYVGIENTYFIAEVDKMEEVENKFSITERNMRNTSIPNPIREKIPELIEQGYTTKRVVAK